MSFQRISLSVALALCIFLTAAESRAMTSCSASCLIGSCSISCPGSGGGGVCGCYAVSLPCVPVAAAAPFRPLL